MVFRRTVPKENRRSSEGRVDVGSIQTIKEDDEDEFNN